MGGLSRYHQCNYVQYTFRGGILRVGLWEMQPKKNLTHPLLTSHGAEPGMEAASKSVGSPPLQLPEGMLYFSQVTPFQILTPEPT